MARRRGQSRLPRGQRFGEYASRFRQGPLEEALVASFVHGPWRDEEHVPEVQSKIFVTGFRGTLRTPIGRGKTAREDLRSLFGRTRAASRRGTRTGDEIDDFRGAACRSSCHHDEIDITTRTSCHLDEMGDFRGAAPGIPRRRGDDRAPSPTAGPFPEGAPGVIDSLVSGAGDSEPLVAHGIHVAFAIFWETGSPGQGYRATVRWLDYSHR
jgi:hypothetical protein